jgi:hypothetical protein
VDHRDRTDDRTEALVIADVFARFAMGCTVLWVRRLLMVVFVLAVIGLGAFAYHSSTVASAPCGATIHGSSLILKGGSGGCVHLRFPVSGSVNQRMLIDVESKMKRLGYTTFVCNWRPGATTVVCAARPN